LWRGTFNTGGDVVAAELAGQRADHGEIDTPRGGRRRPPAAAARGLEMAGVGGDRIGVEVLDGRRAAELAAQPVPERAVDRRVLPPCRRGRRPRRQLLGDGEQVRALGPLPHLAGRRLARARARGKHDVGENLVVRDGAPVDRQLQLGAGPDQRRIFKNPPFRVTLTRRSDGAATAENRLMERRHRPRRRGVGCV
jgi:hypothetical protein